jgi:hypothetical protein
MEEFLEGLSNHMIEINFCQILYEII